MNGVRRLCPVMLIAMPHNVFSQHFYCDHSADFCFLVSVYLLYQFDTKAESGFLLSVVQPKRKQLLSPITTGANRETNQSECKTTVSAKCGVISA